MIPAIVAENSKGWVALIMSVIDLLDVHFNWHFPGVDDEVIMTLVNAVGTVLVWIMPNRAS